MSYDKQIRIAYSSEMWTLEFELVAFGQVSPETVEAVQKIVQPQVMAEMIRINGEHFNSLTLG